MDNYLKVIDLFGFIWYYIYVLVCGNHFGYKSYSQIVDKMWIVFPLIFDKVFYKVVDSVYIFIISYCNYLQWYHVNTVLFGINRIYYLFFYLSTAVFLILIRLPFHLIHEID